MSFLQLHPQGEVVQQDSNIIKSIAVCLCVKMESNLQFSLS